MAAGDQIFWGLVSLQEESCHALLNVFVINFRAVSEVFGKIGLKSSPAVTCSLINSYCIPILLYALEAVTLNKNSRLNLEAVL